MEKSVETIKIRQRRIETATEFCRINLKPGYRQRHDVQLVLDAEVKRMFASRL
jgi:hypothetical protein